MKENQRKLYNHFMEMSKLDNGIKGKNALKYAEDIDSTWDFSGKKAAAIAKAKKEAEAKAKAEAKAQGAK